MTNVKSLQGSGHVLQCGGQLPIKELFTYITFMYFQSKSYPERFHLVEVLSIYITPLWFLGSEGFSHAHKCLLHSPRREHGYLCEFLHTPQQCEAFFYSQVVIQFLYSEGLYSCGSLVEADVCITEPSFCTRQTDMAYPTCLLWYTVKDDLQPRPMTARDLTSGIRHSIKQFLSCVCLMCSELDLLLRPPPLPTSEYSDGHLVEIFPSAFIQVSQL